MAHSKLNFKCPVCGSKLEFTDHTYNKDACLMSNEAIECSCNTCRIRNFGANETLAYFKFVDGIPANVFRARLCDLLSELENSCDNISYNLGDFISRSGA